MPRRKRARSQPAENTPPRKVRFAKSFESTAAASRSKRHSSPDESNKDSTPDPSPIKRGRGRPKSTSTAAAPPSKSKGTASKSAKKTFSPKVVIRTKAKVDEDEDAKNATSSEGEDAEQYWLMKAEPEMRIEDGVQVSYSIDELQNAKAPEPWDGVRNYTARNNLKAMKKGDLAFFYHSNCKTPGVVGIMEIAEEASIDESAFDPKNPYYDEKSRRESPKWFLVRVVFRRKFKNPMSLAEIKSFAQPGGILQNMTLTKQSRLSVSKVSKEEWSFIIGHIGSQEPAEDASKAERRDPAPRKNSLQHEQDESGHTAPVNESGENGNGSVVRDFGNEKAFDRLKDNTGLAGAVEEEVEEGAFFNDHFHPAEEEETYL
ncbi:MAG: hypothetical protein M1833_005339 [Piccolia ochrophora]|nr:MAG: hypothetical protein M1833_005339 [Piccolia ochrophora]